jgi:disulfide bond formation protein DsbB
MRQFMKSHHIHLAAGLASLALIGFAVYYLQGVLGLLPCPLCVMQRIAFLLFGVTALIAGLHRPGGTLRWLYLVLLQLWAAAGAVVRKSIDQATTLYGDPAKPR